jgi:hypothetical protein
MNPVTSVTSIIYGTDGVHQAGVFTPVPTIPPTQLSPNFAALWSGTPASLTSLHPGPSGYEPWSTAFAVEGNIQTGFYAGNTEPYHQNAARWNGTAASYAPLTDAGADNMGAGYGTDGVNIVGRKSMGSIPFNGPYHALLWNSGVNPYVDLNPPGALGSSAFDVEGNIQVGNASFAAGPSHAAIWSGTAASAVDVNPVGATSSGLLGADGGVQVGSANFGTGNNAGLWSGTAASFLNLHSFLTPGTYSTSEATSVWTDGITTRIVGTAFNSVAGRSEAVLWTLVPEPGTISLLAVTGMAGTSVRRRRSDS